jgi:hypothetical protein
MGGGFTCPAVSGANWSNFGSHSGRLSSAITVKVNFTHTKPRCTDNVCAHRMMGSLQ